MRVFCHWHHIVWRMRHYYRCKQTAVHIVLWKYEQFNLILLTSWFILMGRYQSTYYFDWYWYCWLILLNLCGFCVVHWLIAVSYQGPMHDRSWDQWYLYPWFWTPLWCHLEPCGSSLVFHLLHLHLKVFCTYFQRTQISSLCTFGCPKKSAHLEAIFSYGTSMIFTLYALKEKKLLILKLN